MKLSNLDEVRDLARRLRRDLVLETHRVNSPHIGSNLSIVDILATLYARVLRYDAASPAWPARDRFILSKGHACLSLYLVLVEAGFFPRDWLATFYEDGGKLAGHATHKGVPGIEVSTGSLGHGIGLGSGMALAARIAGDTHRIFVLQSDGECDEGSVWEAALFAPHHRLDNLVVIIDHNKIQSLGRVEDVARLEPLADKWAAFGWETREIDGHDVGALDEVLSAVPLVPGKPTCVVAHTVKGKGVSFMEDKLKWHYSAPKGDELTRALVEIGN